MKFGICNETFEGWDLEKACKFAKNCGYTGLEIAPFTLAQYATEVSAPQRAEVRKIVADAGLDVIGLHWLLAKTEGFYLTTPESSVRVATAEYLCELARMCRDLGGHVMVLGSPKQRNLLPGVSHEEGMRLAADTLQRALPTLEECEITIALEPLGPEEGDFLNTADLGAELMRRLDSPWVRLHLDVKAMSTEAKPVCDIIRRHSSVTEHFHANDPNRRGPGMGTVDFNPIFRTLQDVGYGGWVSVEVFDYTPGVEYLAEESIRYMQHCLAALG
jgi:sugar phosphate isomerase/epimerase